MRALYYNGLDILVVINIYLVSIGKKSVSQRKSHTVLSIAMGLQLSMDQHMMWLVLSMELAGIYDLRDFRLHRHTTTLHTYARCILDIPVLMKLQI